MPYDSHAEHGPELGRIGRRATELGVRLSLYPGQFLQPGSPNGDVAERSLAELRYVATLLSTLGISDAMIVLHVGGAYGDRSKAVFDFATALPTEQEVLRYIALENDERTWDVASVAEAASLLHILMVVGTLHHALNPGSMQLSEALDLALPTWKGRPKVHLSSQDAAKQTGVHAWGIRPDDFELLARAPAGRPADVMVESKGKDQAVHKLLADAKVTVA